MKYRIVFFLLSLTFALQATQGKVVNNRQEPLKNVIVSRKNHFVFTDAQGVFNFPYAADSISFHSFGYLPQTVPLDKPFLSVMLIQSPYLMSEFTTSLSVSDAAAKIIFPRQNQLSAADMLLDLSTDKVNNLPGEKKEIGVLGYKSKNTLVLLNGVPLNKPGEAFDLNLIPADIIARIEVKEGMEATGSIINVITNTIDRDYKAEANSYFGAFGLWGNSLTFTLPLFSQSGLLLKTSYQKADNDFSYKNPYSATPDVAHKRKNNGFSEKVYYAKFDNNFGEQQLSMEALINEKKKQLPGPITQMQLFDHSSLDGSKTNLTFNHKFTAAHFVNSNTIYFVRDRSLYDNTRSTLPRPITKNRTTYVRYGFLGGLFIPLGEWESEIKFGKEASAYSFDDFISSQNNYERNGVGNSFFSYAAKIDKQIGYCGITANFGIREDSPHNYSEKIERGHSHNFKLTGKFGEFSCYGQINRSFTLPSFYDLYYKGDMQIAGNPDLKAETSDAVSTGLEFITQGVRLALSYKKDEISNLIYWHQGVIGWKPDNIGSALIIKKIVQGELKPFTLFPVATDPDLLTLKGEYADLHAVDHTLNSSGEPLVPNYGKKVIYQPDSQLTIQAELAYQAFSFSLEYTKIGRQYVTRDNLWGQIPAYELVNTGITFGSGFSWRKITFGIENYLNLNNLQNKQYMTYYAMPGPGFNWQGGVKITVKEKR